MRWEEGRKEGRMRGGGERRGEWEMGEWEEGEKGGENERRGERRRKRKREREGGREWRDVGRASLHPCTPITCRPGAAAAVAGSWLAVIGHVLPAEEYSGFLSWSLHLCLLSLEAEARGMGSWIGPGLSDLDPSSLRRGSYLCAHPFHPPYSPFCAVECTFELETCRHVKVWEALLYRTPVPPRCSQNNLFLTFNGRVQIP